MYEENWKRKHDPYTPVYRHEIVSWYEMLKFIVIKKEAVELNYNLPDTPLSVKCTYLYMKPMEQLFLFDLAPTLMYPRILWCETDNISDEVEREERIRMALEDKPWFQFHADLEIICLHGKEGIHIFWKTW